MVYGFMPAKGTVEIKSRCKPCAMITCRGGSIHCTTFLTVANPIPHWITATVPDLFRPKFHLRRFRLVYCSDAV